jgi:hypothetical protein
MNLFLKIFLWFLAAVALMIGVSIFLTWTTQNEPIVSRFQNAVRNNMTIYSETAAQILENEGETELKIFLQIIKSSETIKGVALISERKKIVFNDGFEVEKNEELIDSALVSKNVEVNQQPQQDSRAAKNLTLITVKNMFY